MDKNKAFPLLLLLLLMFQVLVEAQSQDFTALRGLTENWGNLPPNWVGTDPCGGGWEGIRCNNNSRVISIKLSSMNLTGSLSSEIQSLAELQTLHLSFNKGLTGTIPPAIGNLTKLQILILVGCDFFGTIPDTIGSLKQLTFLALNYNRLSGNIPRTIGNLSNVNWLDLSDNQLEGSIPVSDTKGPGLDMLLKAQHFHFGNNSLSGVIPATLFNKNMILLHVLFDGNQLNGSIPSSLTLVNTLKVVRFDGNQLSGPIPSNISTLINLRELYLSNNNLNGSMPNLSGMDSLTYVDLSNNSFSSSGIPSWASNLPSLTTLKLESTGLQGPIPASIFNQSNLESVNLRSNQLNDTLDIGSDYSEKLKYIDLANNLVTDFKQKNLQNSVEVLLANNPVCLESPASSYCTDTQANPSYSTPSNNCTPLLCSANQISSPNCKCAFPYVGNLSARALGFSNLENSTYYSIIQQTLLAAFQAAGLPVDSVSLSDPLQNSTGYFQLTLQIFPSQSDRFNRTGVAFIASALVNQIYQAPEFFKPYFFMGEDYIYYAGESIGSKSHTGVIVGAVVGVFAFLVIISLVGMYAYRQKRRAERAIEMNPFINWELNKDTGAAPQLKGARWFSYEELRKYTNNFSKSNTIGSGGYGEVYLGTLPTGELVAIKRAKQESMQGAAEFKTEIELLSRVHHKNLVGLVGFCYERGEQMLVYEYISNGTLMDSLSGKSGIRMDWMRRLKVALGAARGLAYLHELANPPIIHRDIKTGNILIDEQLNAKVADFGLSKLLVDGERGHITTQVKGTMGYLDPEYYMTQQLTEKSDVYSFGVVMLELVTARRPIEQGKYIVREVLNVMDRSKDLYNLMSIIDPLMIKVSTPKSLERFVDLALRCVKENGAERPSMAEAVKEIENIMELAGLNPAVESATTSESYEEASGENVRHPYGNEDFNYSGVFPSIKVEPQ